LPEALLGRALTAAEGIGDDAARAGALASLAERLPEPLLERALTAAQGIGSDRARARLLVPLAKRLPEPLLECVLEAAQGIGDDEAKADVLTSLVERLPNARTFAQIPECLAKIRRNAALTLLADVAQCFDSAVAHSIAESITDVCHRWI